MGVFRWIIYPNNRQIEEKKLKFLDMYNENDMKYEKFSKNKNKLERTLLDKLFGWDL